MRDKKSSGVFAMLSLVVLFFGAISSHAQEITIAAAADLRPALDEMAKQLEPAAKIHLHVIYGSSGDLYHQIQNGGHSIFFCRPMQTTRGNSKRAERPWRERITSMRTVRLFLW